MKTAFMFTATQIGTLIRRVTNLSTIFLCEDVWSNLSKFPPISPNRKYLDVLTEEKVQLFCFHSFLILRKTQYTYDCPEDDQLSQKYVKGKTLKSIASEST